MAIDADAELAIEAWSSALAREGRAEVFQRRALVLTEMAVWLGAIAFALASALAADGFSQVLAWVALVVLPLVGAHTVRAALVRGPSVVVDARGIDMRELGLEIPWSAAHDAEASTNRNGTMVILTIDDELGREWKSRRSGLGGFLSGQSEASAVEIGRLAIPRRLDIEPEAFAAWLSREIERRNPDVPT